MKRKEIPVSFTAVAIMSKFQQQQQLREFGDSGEQLQLWRSRVLLAIDRFDDESRDRPLGVGAEF